MTGSVRAGEVLARLAAVSDPELDEPVTELGFVTEVAVDEAGAVAIGFRLPTYWCAANFAFLMADDMHRAAAALPWVSAVRVTLGEHMYADTINQATAAGQSFQEAFAAEADGNLDELRRVFLLKAFQSRQLPLLDHLRRLGHEPATILGWTVGELAALDAGPEGRALAARYLARRGVPGPDGPGDPAFVDADGRPVTPEGYDAHRRTLRRVAVGVEFNGALCRGLLAARFNEPDGAPAEPTLLDFIRGRVPERPAATA